MKMTVSLNAFRLYKSTIQVQRALNLNCCIIPRHFSIANDILAGAIGGGPDAVTNTTTTVEPEKIIGECLKFRSSYQEVNDRYKGPLEKSAQKNTILPFVFLLGNHSAGKSSFINYVCDRKVR